MGHKRVQFLPWTKHHPFRPSDLYPIIVDEAQVLSFWLLREKNEILCDIYPGAEEQCGDGIDQDCNEADLPCQEESSCQAWTATYNQHVIAGRAYMQTEATGCGNISVYYAAGSNTYLGSGGALAVGG